MSKLPITIVDGTTKAPVEALLRSDLQPIDLVQIEGVWGPARIQSAQALLTAGAPPEQLPQHWHWNWANKASNLQLLAYSCFGIECQGAMQGLMMVTTAGHVARLGPDRGRPLVYVDYIESAPWNLAVLSKKPKFSAIGVRLIKAAIRLSLDEEFHGRLGLHSLPRAEKFYRDTCRMTGLGADAGYQNLPYYEMTRMQATEFLAGGTT
jgi:hypothetical protein